MKVLIFKHGKINYTETFIEANIKELPFAIEVIQANPIPFIGNQKPLLLTKIFFFLQKIIKLFNPDLEKKIRHISYSYLLKRVNPDVVLAQFGHSGAVISRACSNRNIPFIVYFRGYDATAKHVLKKYKEDYRMMFKKCIATISVSRSIRNKIISLGANSKTAFVAPSGADINFFKRHSPLTKKKSLLFVGRFVPKKAPHLLILSFSKVYAKHKDSKLFMVGDGPLFEVCQDLVKALDLERAVEFCGKKNHEQIKNIMAQTLVYVQHSVTASNGDSEGTPVAILEAGSSGVPVVSTRHAGISDAIIDGKTGFLVDEKNIHQMTYYIDLLLDDYELAKKMGDSARIHIEQNFSQSLTIERISKILQWAYNSRIEIPDLFPNWEHIKL